MKHAMIALMMLGVALAGCAGGPDSENPEQPSDNPRLTNAWSFDDLVPPESVRFVVIGDAGSGEENQEKVAHGLETICRQTGCDFVMVAGDNIYNNGVRSEYDPQFESKFEKPYARIDMPFYLVLGNHDNGDGGGTNPHVGDYQVLYAKRTDRSSLKWHMPARYYTHSLGNVTIVGIDSGPAEIARDTAWLPDSRGAAMERWVAQEIPKITTKWKFAFAHHAYWSNSAHQDAGSYDGVAGRGLFFQRLLENHVCGKVDVYFAAHDHNLQWLEQAPSCRGTELIISGAGGRSLYGPRATGKHPAYFEDYQHYGFWWIDVTGNTFTGVAYDADGNKLFERSFTKSG